MSVETSKTAANDRWEEVHRQLSQLRTMMVSKGASQGLRLEFGDMGSEKQA